MNPLTWSVLQASAKDMQWNQKMQVKNATTQIFCEM